MEMDSSEIDNALREQFHAKRSQSMRVPLKRLMSFVPTIYPKKKDKALSPLNLIKSAINEDKEGGYSEGEDDKSYPSFRYSSRMRPIHFEYLLKKYSSSTKELPKIEINENNNILSKVSNGTCFSVAKKFQIIPQTEIEKSKNQPHSPQKKRISILNHLEKKRKFTMN